MTGSVQERDVPAAEQCAHGDLVPVDPGHVMRLEHYQRLVREAQQEQQAGQK